MAMQLVPSPELFQCDMELVKDDKEKKILALAGEVCKDKELTLGTDCLAAIQVLVVAYLAIYVMQNSKDGADAKLLVFAAVCILMVLLFSLRSQQTTSLVEKERRDSKENILKNVTQMQEAEFQQENERRAYKEKMVNIVKEMRDRELNHKELGLKHQQEMRERELKHREEYGGGDCQIM